MLGSENSDCCRDQKTLNCMAKIIICWDLKILTVVGIRKLSCMAKIILCWDLKILTSVVGIRKL